MLLKSNKITQDKKTPTHIWHLPGIPSWCSSLPCVPSLPPCLLPYAPCQGPREEVGSKQNDTASPPSKASKGRGSVIIKARELHQDPRGGGEPSKAGDVGGQQRGGGFWVSLDKQRCWNGLGRLHPRGRRWCTQTWVVGRLEIMGTWLMTCSCPESRQ